MEPIFGIRRGEGGKMKYFCWINISYSTRDGCKCVFVGLPLATALAMAVNNVFISRLFVGFVSTISLEGGLWLHWFDENAVVVVVVCFLGNVVAMDL